MSVSLIVLLEISFLEKLDCFEVEGRCDIVWLRSLMSSTLSLLSACCSEFMRIIHEKGAAIPDEYLVLI